MGKAEVYFREVIECGVTEKLELKKHTFSEKEVTTFKNNICEQMKTSYRSHLQFNASEYGTGLPGIEKFWEKSETWFRGQLEDLTLKMIMAIPGFVGVEKCGSLFKTQFKKIMRISWDDAENYFRKQIEGYIAEKANSDKLCLGEEDKE